VTQSGTQTGTQTDQQQPPVDPNGTNCPPKPPQTPKNKQQNKQQKKQNKKSHHKNNSKSNKHSSTNHVNTTPPPAISQVIPSSSLGVTSPLTGLGLPTTDGSVPPSYLIPIYQAAGAKYGIPWEVLAAINKVETNYGQDLSTSSAGAEGWMQFMPGTWAQYGVDANNDGKKDPNNPADAIFSAAAYLQASGGSTNIQKAIFSYNHAQWYVDEVLGIAQGISAMHLGGDLSLNGGQFDGVFPVWGPAHYSAKVNDLKPLPSKADGRAHESSLGRAVGNKHSGSTISAAGGTSVVAVNDGKVVNMGFNRVLGNFVRIRDKHGNLYTYGRLGRIADNYPHKVSKHAINPLDKQAPAKNAKGKPNHKKPPKNPTQGFITGDNAGFKLEPLRPGVHVLKGTVLGNLGKTTKKNKSSMFFELRTGGKKPHNVNPAPFLDEWMLLEATKSGGIFSQGYVSPFTGAQVSQSRVDMGVDYGISGPIRAVGNSVVVFVGQIGGFGNYLAYQLTTGPYAGKYIYVSEHMTPIVTVGQHLAAGQVIAMGSGGIETGWAQGAAGGYMTLAKVTGGWDSGLDSENAVTAAGLSFDRFMRALGVQAGTVGGPLVGSVAGLGLP
jgi:murein DD-endopeptidase MepM/ murein hydrolase activator NlpD